MRGASWHGLDGLPYLGLAYTSLFFILVSWAYIAWDLSVVEYFSTWAKRMMCGPLSFPQVGDCVGLQST